MTYPNPRPNKVEVPYVLRTSRFLRFFTVTSNDHCSAIGLCPAIYDTISETSRHVLSFGALNFSKSFWEGVQKMFSKKLFFLLFPLPKIGKMSSSNRSYEKVLKTKKLPILMINLTYFMHFRPSYFWEKKWS